MMVSSRLLRSFSNLSSSFLSILKRFHHFIASFHFLYSIFSDLQFVYFFFNLLSTKMKVLCYYYYFNQQTSIYRPFGNTSLYLHIAKINQFCKVSQFSDIFFRIKLEVNSVHSWWSSYLLHLHIVIWYILYRFKAVYLTWNTRKDNNFEERNQHKTVWIRAVSNVNNAVNTLQKLKKSLPYGRTCHHQQHWRSDYQYISTVGHHN